MRRVLFFLVLVCAVPSSAEDKGTYQLSTGVNYFDRARKNPDFMNKETAPAKLEYWFLDKFSMRVKSSLLVSKDRISPPSRVTGRGDAFVGGTYTFQDTDAKHALGVQLDYEVKFPTAIKGLGSDQFDHQILGVLYHSFLDDRLYSELDAGASVTGRQGKSSAAVPLMTVAGSYGLVHQQGAKSFKLKLFHEFDYSPAAPGAASSATGLDELVYRRADWTFQFGPSYSLTPYDSRVGFAIGVKYSGCWKCSKKKQP